MSHSGRHLPDFCEPLHPRPLTRFALLSSYVFGENDATLPGLMAVDTPNLSRLSVFQAGSALTQAIGEPGRRLLGEPPSKLVGLFGGPVRPDGEHGCRHTVHDAAQPLVRQSALRKNLGGADGECDSACKGLCLAKVMFAEIRSAELA